MSDLLRGKIKDRTAKVCVVGLGYVGLPMVMALTKAGFETTGIDKDQKKVDAFARGECYLEHVELRKVQDCVASGKMACVSTSIQDAADCDVYLICVPTPVDETRSPDLRFVEAAAEDVAVVARPGVLVVLESTVAPGTTRGMLDVFRGNPGVLVAYSPEREDPGNEHYWTQNTPKLVGGIGQVAGDAAYELYSAVCEEVVRVDMPEVAEMAKLFENTFRLVNIALVNELKIVCNELDLDVWDVIKAANTKPFGFKAFWPGPGVGGHCVPIDSHYYSCVASDHGIETGIVDAAFDVVDHMPRWVASEVTQFLHSRHARILILGVAYKRGVGDCRESPALQVIRELQEWGHVVAVHDPFVRNLSELAAGVGCQVETELNEAAIREADVVLVLTDHRQRVDWGMVLGHARLVVDTRGFLEPGENVVRL